MVLRWCWKIGPWSAQNVAEAFQRPRQDGIILVCLGWRKEGRCGCSPPRRFRDRGLRTHCSGLSGTVVTKCGGTGRGRGMLMTHGHSDSSCAGGRGIISCTRKFYMRQFKVIVEKHPDGYVAYPLGLKGVCVAQGDTYAQALAEVQSAIRFHLETFGSDAVSARC